MPDYPTWRPDSTKPVSSDAVPAEAVPQEAAPFTTAPTPDDNLAAARQELADLAAQFAAHGGGNPLPESPGEFAQDDVLNEIVDQACLATGATGAAISLARGGEMICRASSGSGVPELGIRLNMNSWLRVASARTRQIQRCDDLLSDPDAAEIPRQLGVGSLVVLPLVRDEELIGIFEVVSSRSHAFGDRDLRTLEVLAERILKNAQAHQSSSVSAGLIGASNEIGEPLKTELASFLPVSDRLPDAMEARPAQGIDWLTGVIAAILLSVAILMGAVLGMRLGSMSARARPSPSRAVTVQVPTSPAAIPANEPNGMRPTETISAEKEPAKSSESRAKRVSFPEGELRVYENGKEIFHVPPGGTDATASSTGSGETTEGRLQPAGLIELSPAAAEGILVNRVEPEYPEQALMQHVQGPVVLDVHMDREGIVQDVTLVSGDILLGEAATAAVRQWRFKPQKVNGQPVEMETKVTLRFTLPPS
jgi:TonB family protein